MSIVVNKTRLPVTQWQTESGSVVSVSDARKRYAKSLSVALEPIQDLHGYSYPWVGGAGKNKCSMADQTFVQYLEVEIDEIPAGTYNYSAVVTSSDTDDTKCAIVFLDADKNTLSAKSLSRSVGGSRVSTEFTISSPIKYLRLYASSGWPSGAGDTASFADNMICLASATDPTIYAPYENLCPISGRSSVTAVRDGKNLLRLVESEMESRGYDRYFPNPIPYAGRYTLTCRNVFGGSGNKGAAVVFKNEVGGGNIGSYFAGYSFGVTTFSGASNTVTEEMASAKYIAFLARSNGMPFNDIEGADIQIELGSTATAYEPYNGTSVEVALGQTVYGCSVDLVSGVMRVTKKSVTFIGDNSYMWYTYDPDNYDSFCFAVDLPDKSKKKLTSICDKYKNVDASWGAGGDGKYCVFSDHTTLARLYFRPPYSGFGETVADWKTWLSNNPLQVCYELATPQIIQLSTNQIEMLMRNNTVWSDAGLVTLNYARIRQ